MGIGLKTVSHTVRMSPYKVLPRNPIPKLSGTSSSPPSEGVAMRTNAMVGSLTLFKCRGVCVTADPASRRALLQVRTAHMFVPPSWEMNTAFRGQAPTHTCACYRRNAMFISHRVVGKWLGWWGHQSINALIHGARCAPKSNPARGARSLGAGAASRDVLSRRMRAGAAERACARRRPCADGPLTTRGPGRPSTGSASSLPCHASAFCRHQLQDV